MKFKVGDKVEVGNEMFSHPIQIKGLDENWEKEGSPFRIGTVFTVTHISDNGMLVNINMSDSHGVHEDICTHYTPKIVKESKLYGAMK